MNFLTSILLWLYMWVRLLRPLLPPLLVVCAIIVSFTNVSEAIYLLLLAIYFELSTEKP